ncbi:hypothetical protein POM88_005783 [Heracleum sosnowskyi]|uniref:Transposase-associated domain-containing protein n=1 Tax=Heracleum sosnowskyi TaxID=360622 RepID=A0AAD8J536_9APIA|nr:hypothetical protein POM88_005783 [Heracleum sosnowskyi]
MALDHSWIGHNRYNEAKYLTEEYKVGVENFIKHAIENMQKEDNGRVRCPCRECGNSFYKYPSAVRVDLYRHGIMPWYTIWDCHGEEDMPRVQVGTSSANTNYRDDDMYNAHDDDFVDCENFEEPNATTNEFYRMCPLDASPISECVKRCNRPVLIHGRVSRARGARKLQSMKGVVKKVLWNLNSPSESHMRGNSVAAVKVVTQKNHPSMRDQQCILLNRKRNIIEPEAKHTLQHIVRIRWVENTINTKGSNREDFYDGCILKFQEYYKYPDGYEIPQGDRIVRAHLKKNFKQYLCAEKSRLIKQLRELMKIGYTDSEIDLELLKPHYYSQRAWNSILEYWGIIQFETRSDIDAEREAKGEMPILDDEFMGLVYDPCEPAVIELQEKVRKVKSELTLEEESTNEPPSRYTQMELYKKKDLIATIQVRPPNRGRVLFRPQSTVGELLGAREAAQWVSSKEKTSPHDNAIADEIYSRMSTILDDVRQMVCSLPMREVKKSDLDERLRNLADATLPDPIQLALQLHYVRAATGLLRQILKDNNKVIVEENLPEKALLVHDVGNDEANYNKEDVDEDAHMFPLS